MPTKLSLTFGNKDTEVTDDPRNASPGRGRITHGPDANAFLERTFEFVRGELPAWRDRPDRRAEHAEEKLNAQLSKHLNSRARFELPMVQFHHEEKQTEARRVDISAGLSEGGFIGSSYYSIDDPFVVFEGKRLPAPGGKSRQREYVTGGDAKTGGIQRFKLGLHGAQFEIVVMVGYIQKGKPSFWHNRINQWICDLSETLPLGEEKWSAKEQLSEFAEDSVARISASASSHLRIGKTKTSKIRIRHFWVEMS
jgi:hypothetical protein